MISSIYRIGESVFGSEGKNFDSSAPAYPHWVWGINQKRNIYRYIKTITKWKIDKNLRNQSQWA